MTDSNHILNGKKQLLPMLKVAELSSTISCQEVLASNVVQRDFAQTESALAVVQLKLGHNVPTPVSPADVSDGPIAGQQVSTSSIHIFGRAKLVQQNPAPIL